MRLLLDGVVIIIDECELNFDFLFYFYFYFQGWEDIFDEPVSIWHFQ
jgi:hypothetical protein